LGHTRIPGAGKGTDARSREAVGFFIFGICQVFNAGEGLQALGDLPVRTGHQHGIERAEVNGAGAVQGFDRGQLIRPIGDALTTPVNEQWHRQRKSFDRLEADVHHYNRIARRVMKAHDIPLNDLGAVIREAHRDTCLKPDGVHMNAKGNALFSTGPNSGQALVTSPGSQAAGKLVSGALELSNVDLGQEFIDLILTSTGYSASSRVIRTTDELMQQLLVLGR